MMTMARKDIIGRCAIQGMDWKLNAVLRVHYLKMSSISDVVMSSVMVAMLVTMEIIKQEVYLCW